jgi:hypothetical protein
MASGRSYACEMIGKGCKTFGGSTMAGVTVKDSIKQINPWITRCQHSRNHVGMAFNLHIWLQV